MNITSALEQSVIHQFQFMDRDEFDKSWFISSTIMMVMPSLCTFLHVDSVVELYRENTKTVRASTTALRKNKAL